MHDVARICTCAYQGTFCHTLSRLFFTTSHHVAPEGCQHFRLFELVPSGCASLGVLSEAFRGGGMTRGCQGADSRDHKHPQTMTPSLYTFVRISTRPYHLSMKVSETPHDVAERTMPPLSKVFCTIGRLFVLRCLPYMCDASICAMSGVRHHVSLPRAVSALPPARAHPSRQHPPTLPSPAISWHLVPWLCQASFGPRGQATRS